jgi:hypothetical protein
MGFGRISAESGGCDMSGSKPWLFRRDSLRLPLLFEEDLDIVPVNERLSTGGMLGTGFEAGG